MNNYYYMKNGLQYGPISPSQFAANGVDADTMIWCQGMESWQPASALPGLSSYLSTNSEGSANSYGGNNSMVKPPKPDNHMVEAVLTTLCCCLPIGIYAVIQASQVNSLYSQGKYDEAEATSEDVGKWTKIAIVIGAIINILYVIIAMAANGGR